jgi:hypothetical protein
MEFEFSDTLDPGASEGVSSFISPEARATGGIANIIVKPPCPWNEDLVDSFLIDYGESEQPPYSSIEWTIRAGRQADAGRRRYSAYSSYQFRDGPLLDSSLHPSRSALRPLASCPTRSLAADCLEAARPSGAGDANESLALGSAADSLECRFAGTGSFPLPGGVDAWARGACSPTARPRRPFTGLRLGIVAPCAAVLMEAHPAADTRRGPPRLDPVTRRCAPAPAPTRALARGRSAWTTPTPS